MSDFKGHYTEKHRHSVRRRSSSLLALVTIYSARAA
jgi:hypothetical protein